MAKAKKNLAQGQDEMPEVKKYPFTKNLKVALTKDEVLSAAESLARTLDELNSLEDDKKSLTDSFKAKITEAEARATQFKAKVRDKYEWRPVDCEETRDPTEGTVVVVRLDTNETIEDRKMTYDERQGQLFQEEAAA